MYQDALDAGITPARFWQMSVPDIVDTIDSARRMQRAKQKEILSYMWQHVYMLSQAFDGKLKPVEELYPELFADELQAEAEADSVEAVAESRRRWAAEMNSRRHSEATQ